MDVVAQWVRTSWSPDSRGGPAAARRNAAPVGFVLPDERRPAVHEVHMDERDHFRPSAEFHDGPPDPERVILAEDDGRLRVELVPQAWGNPQRAYRPDGVWLLPGQWVRWQINYRYHYGDARWSYELVTLNLAYGRVPVNVFRGKPTRRVDERGSIYY